MRNLNYTIIALILTSCLFAQKNSGKIVYEIANIDFQDKGTNSDITAMLTMAKKQLYILNFNKSFSSFTMREKMSNENFSEFHNMLAKNFISSSDYYFDFKNNTILETIGDGTLLEQKAQKLPWVIGNETKKIDQYECYKATYSFEYLARDQKMKIREITAWFAPGLPYPYGPKNYYGLPGLILELTDRTTTFLVSKIEFSDNEIEINIPAGKRIDKVSFDKMINNQ